MFNLVQVRVVTKSSPPPRSLPPPSFISSGQRLPPPPHFNGKDTLALDTSPSPLFPSLSPSPPPPRPRLWPPLRSRSVPRPKSESRSPSLSFPRCRPPRLICEEGSLFFSPPRHSGFLYHPLASSFCPRPRLRSCAGKLGMYSTFIFLMISDLDTLSGPRRSRPRHAGHTHTSSRV